MRRVAIAVEQNWYSVPGGTARSTNRLVEELLTTDAVALVGLHGRHRRTPTLSVPADLEVCELPVPGRLLDQTWNLIGRPTIDRWVDADVVHAPAYSMPPSRRPTVATIHDLAFIRHPEWFTAHGVAHMNRFLRRVIDGRALVIVPSEQTADDCLALGIDSSRLTVVPWGVDRVDFEASEIARVGHDHGVDAETALFVGTIEPRKNLDGLARAMLQLPDRRLVVVGPSGWGDVVVEGAHLTGELDNRTVRALMAAAGVLVYPSHFEGFGLPVLEAMSAGTAVITTAGTASAVVGGEAALSIDTSSPTKLAEAIEGVLSDDELRERLAAAGRNRSRQFSWSATAEQTMRVYEMAAA